MYKELKELINSSKKMVLVSHVEPDGDAIGSSLAFYLAMKKIGKNVKIFNKTEIIANKYNFLKGFDKITNKIPSNIDLMISFDCGSFKRIGIDRVDGCKLVNIDHHKSNEEFGDLNIINSDFASTSSVVYDILVFLGIKIDKDIAQAIYTALAEDTNFFSDSTTDERVFELAKNLVLAGAKPDIVGKNLLRRESLAKLRLESLFIDRIVLKKDAKVAIGYVDEDMLESSGALRYDTAHLADILQSIATVKFSIFTLQMPNNIVKFSLRSEDIDVSKIAKSFGGGGHSESAGFSVLESERESVIEEILRSLDI